MWRWNWIVSLAVVTFSEAAFSGSSLHSKRHDGITSCKASWSDLDQELSRPYIDHLPTSIDSVLDSSTPDFSTDRATLFRERHGWCPYSERVWMTLELAGVNYDTIRIDNTGGPRPSYYGGLTPQMKWPDGRKQGESMDLVNEVDQRFANGQFQSNSKEVQDVVRQFSNIFPSARPSSRAAYLFQYSGEPLWKSTFEKTLQDTNALLGETDGPFLCGSEITVADIAWAPFLERYRYQLPCLHDGLDPADPKEYPLLAKWFASMDKIPVYGCRVKGDASSWRKVLSMAGFGNAGVPSQVQDNMDDLIAKEEAAAQTCIDLEVWKSYVATRPYVAPTPHQEAAAIITRNRGPLIRDICKQGGKPAWSNRGLPSSAEAAEAALLELAMSLKNEGSLEGVNSKEVGILASFLDDRMCVPRDMGAMSAASIKNLAVAWR